MGGRALGYESRRIDNTELAIIKAKLEQDFSEFDPAMISAYFEKETHGDIDMVLVGSHGDVRDKINLLYNNPTSYDNNPVYSFDYDGVQVDFTSCPTATKQQALLNYFAWNDLGNFIGRVARSIGFKYGQDGLSYIVRLSDHAVTEFVVSTDMRKILTFLGYDFDVWQAGFATKESIFEYAASSLAFNPLYFSLEDQSHQDRTRNRKRKMYQSMLEYIERKGLQPRPKLDEANRTLVLIAAHEYFRDEIDLLGTIKQITEKYAESERLKQKYNGNLVRKWTGLEGKELGAAVSGFKNSYGDHFNEMLATNTPKQIKAKFTAWLAASGD